MGGPPGVANSAAPRVRLGRQEGFESLIDLALALEQVEPAALEQRHPGAIVTAVLKPSKSFQKNGAGSTFADVSDDAAHER
jgi:hypothetical protein